MWELEKSLLLGLLLHVAPVACLGQDPTFGQMVKSVLPELSIWIMNYCHDYWTFLDLIEIILLHWPNGCLAHCPPKWKIWCIFLFFFLKTGKTWRKYFSQAKVLSNKMGILTKFKPDNNSRSELKFQCKTAKGFFAPLSPCSSVKI